MENHRNRTRVLLLSTVLLSGCGPSIGGVGMGGMPMGVGMMGMPMGGYAYGGAWGHSTNVIAYDRHTSVDVVNHANHTYDTHGGGFYHPGRMR